MKSLLKSQFIFHPHGYGHYAVIYHTAKRGDYYVAVIDDMPLIDETLNEDSPSAAALQRLADRCRAKGTHYHKDGSRFDF